MTYLILYILWFCVSLLCINCMNTEYGAKAEWEKSSYVWKTIYIVGSPVIYLIVGSIKAFKK